MKRGRRRLKKAELERLRSRLLAMRRMCVEGRNATANAPWPSQTSKN